ncbi:MAG: MFS transporter, partial [Gammaproteobacteria bacterium]
MAFYKNTKYIKTLIPYRLDRLPLSLFHWKILLALGTTWILDGLEITIKGAISITLQHPQTLHLTSTQIGLAASFYLTGAVIGALFFGYLTDKYGRRRFFFITLGVYLLGVILSVFSWDFISLAVARTILGLGIGGEYTAINSAIDELMPAKVRGRISLAVNSSYWLGAAAGALMTSVILTPGLFPIDIGWRICLGLGAILGIITLVLRKFVPESPRWLVLHGHAAQAEQLMHEIEQEVDVNPEKKLDINKTPFIISTKVVNFRMVLSAIFNQYRKRALVTFTLMISQAFLYNAIFFTYVLILNHFYDIPAEKTGIYLLAFALSNFLGPVLLGQFFDTIGRKFMIVTTYIISAILLILTAYLFLQHSINAT